MTTPKRDSLGAMFDQYAAATAAETTRATTGQLRRRMYRHRSVRVAAAGVAAAVLAVPGGWMIQQAGASDGPTGAADQGTSEEPTEEVTECETIAPIVYLPDGATLNEFFDGEVEALAVSIPPGTSLEGLPENHEGFQVDAVEVDVLEVDLISEGDGFGVSMVVPEGTTVEELLDLLADEEKQAESAARCEMPPTESPTDGGGTPTDESSESDESTPGSETTDAGEDPTEAGDEEPTGESTPGGDEESTPGDDQEPTASEQLTPLIA